MLANNETGVIQPVAEAAALVRAAGGWLHVDAVQAAGKIAVDFDALGADTLALSGPQAGRPARRRRAGRRAARGARRAGMHGGGQERGRRAGTENVSGIAGFGAAAAAALRDLADAGRAGGLARRGPAPDRARPASTVFGARRAAPAADAVLRRAEASRPSCR